MIGNDVVDLKLAAQQSNWRRKGFIGKIFSETEQEIIATSHDPDRVVWLLWSMKEAAYKAHQRQFNLPRRLNWQAQQCSILHYGEKKASGIVRIGNSVYKTASEIVSEYIYTSAANKNLIGVKNVILEASSSEAKELLHQQISQFFGIIPRELQLQKDVFGMPFFNNNNSFFFNRFSLSGHGRFSAYNLSLINCETPVKQS